MSEFSIFMGPNYIFKLGIKVLDLVPILGKTNYLACVGIETSSKHGDLIQTTLEGGSLCLVCKEFCMTK